MTSKVTSSTVSEVKFASETDNINPLTLSDIKNGFAGCSGAGIPMTSANFNAVLNWITENIGLEADMVVETIKGKKYLTTKAKDGSTAKIEISKLIKDLRDSGVVTTDDFGDGFKFNAKTNKYDVALGKSLTFNENGDINIKSNPSGGVVINEDGLAELSLSKDNGNLLEMRKDGLFYGTQASPNLYELYVDAVSGVDQDPEVVSGAGTRAKPLRTLKYAQDLAKQGSTRRIRLKENQTHVVSAESPIFIKQGDLTVLSYGPKYDALYAETGNGFITDQRLVQQGDAANIKMVGVLKSNYSAANHNLYSYRIFILYSLTSVNFRGVDFENVITSTIESTAENSSLISKFGRFETDGGSLILQNFSYKSTGTITGIGSHRYITEGFKTDGVYNTGLLHPINGNIILRSLLNSPVSGMVDNILSHQGWDPETLPASFVFSMANSGMTKEHYKRVKRIKLARQPSGDTYILTPTTDVEASMFT